MIRDSLRHYLSNRKRFLCLHVLALPDINTRGVGRIREKYANPTRTRDEVEGLHNCREFSQPLECLYQDTQTQEKGFLLLL